MNRVKAQTIDWIFRLLVIALWLVEVLMVLLALDEHFIDHRGVYSVAGLVLVLYFLVLPLGFLIRKRCKRIFWSLTHIHYVFTLWQVLGLDVVMGDNTIMQLWLVLGFVKFMVWVAMSLNTIKADYKVSYLVHGLTFLLSIILLGLATLIHVM